MSNDSYSRDPDDLYGDTKTHVIEIAIRRNGSMSVAGSINDLPHALAMLDNARDCILRHHGRRGSQIVTQPEDAPRIAA